MNCSCGFLFRACVAALALCLLLPASAMRADDAGAAKKIVFVAGRDSHGHGAHEHSGGCRVLAASIEASGLPVETVVHTGGWPEDDSIFDGAATIVVYADGGGGHPINAHLDSVDRLMKKGVGLVCLHYAVEVEKGKKEERRGGDSFLDWIGGYFETHHSVNPHWTAKFTKFPDHAISRGVRPFEINDEWYYSMRFREGMEGVTPILTSVPPDETRKKPFGPHSGNPWVRSRLGEPEHVAWARERPDGGRGFGFTGGHVHWNWGQPDFLKLVLNAIVWTAKIDVPEGGVNAPTPTREVLEAAIKGPAPGATKPPVARAEGRRQADFASKLVTRATGPVEIDVDIRGAKKLWLIVTDGGNGFSCDWSDWAEPRLVGPDGEKRLTDLDWKSATSDWGRVQKNRNAGGGPLSIAGKVASHGIGTHANSEIVFELPSGYERFRARGGLDNGGTDQGACGDQAAVEFLVYTKEPPRRVASRARGAAGAEERDPASAVDGLDVHESLEATLFASEPMIQSPTNLDVDHLGRVWLCEVVNYRGHNGKRPEGDRILILEDTDGDGVADSSKVFYQGRDVDSAMGICVLGDADSVRNGGNAKRVIVSAAPLVLVFHDEDGDDVPERKEVLFSNTGTPQHDHSNHSFVFGPDGKMYWNFGNTGKHVHDASGKIVTDRSGHEVRDNGRPYFGGMVFRCNLDGSEFEVLGHNFRNNYEMAVDSFGTVWQSDNDDDGNRGVRINYVMEHGNFGYRDELTGAGWQSPRTNIESEVPLRHWHLNDPGVVPNLLQTGAGSPTGIAVYEGDLLPAVFRGQVIHCDAGPNVVRAYPVEDDGAGYSASIVNILEGTRDRWFRPADVCVAPDGSLLVTDWYDPGVGGHGMGDLARGRVFRVAPKGHRVRVPKLDLSTAVSAARSLVSPNHAVRALAWQALRAMGADAEPALVALWRSENPRHRARALWLLAKIEGRAAEWVEHAIEDADPDLRTTGIRVARQSDLDVLGVLERVVDDVSPRVRREALLALREYRDARAGKIWARLANHHDGKDRWYLEAIGIAADGKWDEWLAQWMEIAGKESFHSARGRDIVWRSRAAVSPAILASMLKVHAAPRDEMARYLRAFDFWSGELRNEALLALATGNIRAEGEVRDYVVYEATTRLGDLDLAKNPNLKKALESLLAQTKGTAAFVGLVRRFELKDRFDELASLARNAENTQLAVDAARTLLDMGGSSSLREGLRAPGDDGPGEDGPGEDGPGDDGPAVALATTLGLVGDDRSLAMLFEALDDEELPMERRRGAARGIVKSRKGATRLLERARKDELETPLGLAASADLARAPWGDLRAAAAELFPLAATKSAKPLPPVSDLVKMRGDADRGKTVFSGDGTCANCHQVGDLGKPVGPGLGEIGSKLSREALWETILYPSAAISHSFETHVLVKKSGETLSGIRTSETEQDITIRDANAIEHRVQKSELLRHQVDPLSLMPADLQKLLEVEQLVDVVEYLLSLKKAS